WVSTSPVAGVSAFMRSRAARNAVSFRVTHRFGVAPSLPVVGGVKCNAFGSGSELHLFYMNQRRSLTSSCSRPSYPNPYVVHVRHFIMHVHHVSCGSARRVNCEVRRLERKAHRRLAATAHPCVRALRSKCRCIRSCAV